MKNNLTHDPERSKMTPFILSLRVMQEDSISLEINKGINISSAIVKSTSSWYILKLFRVSCRDGTTDTTRTVHFGQPTKHQKVSRYNIVTSKLILCSH